MVRRVTQALSHASQPCALVGMKDVKQHECTCVYVRVLMGMRVHACLQTVCACMCADRGRYACVQTVVGMHVCRLWSVCSTSGSRDAPGTSGTLTRRVVAGPVGHMHADACRRVQQYACVHADAAGGRLDNVDVHMCTRACVQMVCMHTHATCGAEKAKGRLDHVDVQVVMIGWLALST